MRGNIEEQTIEYHKVTERDADNSSKQTERLTERPGWKGRVGKSRDFQMFNTVEHDEQEEDPSVRCPREVSGFFFLNSTGSTLK